MADEDQLRKIEEEVARRREEDRKKMEEELRAKFEAEAKAKAEADAAAKQAADEKAAMEQKLKDMEEKQRLLEERFLAGQTTKRGVGAPLQSPFKDDVPVKGGIDSSKLNFNEVEKLSEKAFFDSTRK
jgi:hypothetical protein